MMPTDLWRILTSPQARKFQMVLIGVAVSAATAGLFPAAVSVWVLLVVGVLTSAGVYVVPNSEAPVLTKTVAKHVVEPTTEPQNAPVEVFTTGTTMG